MLIHVLAVQRRHERVDVGRRLPLRAMATPEAERVEDGGHYGLEARALGELLTQPHGSVLQERIAAFADRPVLQDVEERLRINRVVLEDEPPLPKGVRGGRELPAEGLSAMHAVALKFEHHHLVPAVRLMRRDYLELARKRHPPSGGTPPQDVVADVVGRRRGTKGRGRRTDLGECLQNGGEQRSRLRWVGGSLLVVLGRHGSHGFLRSLRTTALDSATSKNAEWRGSGGAAA